MAHYCPQAGHLLLQRKFYCNTVPPIMFIDTYEMIRVEQMLQRQCSPWSLKYLPFEPFNSVEGKSYGSLIPRSPIPQSIYWKNWRALRLSYKCFSCKPGLDQGWVPSDVPDLKGPRWRLWKRYSRTQVQGQPRRPNHFSHPFHSVSWEARRLVRTLYHLSGVYRFC